jgi:hypothetical protein
MDSMMQTLQFGSMLGQMGQVRDQREAAALAAQEKAAKDAQIQEAFNAARENPTYENYRRLADMSPPEQAKSFRESWDMLDQAQQRQALNDTVSIYAGFQSGAPEISLSMIEKRIEAAKNAGDTESAKRYQSMLDLAQSGPEGVKAVKDMFAMSITGMTGGKEAMEALGKLGEEQRAAAAEPDVIKKRLADIGYTEAQTNKFLAETRKLDAETKKLAVDLETMNAAGGLDPEKKFNSELALNKEYTTRTKGYDESLRLADVIETSAQSASGAGDLALVTTFMKMIDPGSVVRESEFAKAQDTAGLMGKLLATASRVQNGQILTPDQRKDFVALSKQYMQASTDHEKRVREGLDFMVKSYGLNADNVFGLKADDTAPQAADGTTAAPAPIADIGALKAFIKSIRPASEHAEIDALDEAGLRREFPKSVAKYQPGGAAAAPATAEEPIVRGDF